MSFARDSLILAASNEGTLVALCLGIDGVSCYQPSLLLFARVVVVMKGLSNGFVCVSRQWLCFDKQYRVLHVR